MDGIIIDERKKINDMALMYVYSSTYLILISTVLTILKNDGVPSF